MITRYILPLVSIAGIIFAVVFVGAANKPTPATLPVADPAMAPFSSYIAGAGLVEASTENINVGTPVAGVVTNLDHWIGDRVNKGEVLFRVDSRDQEAELEVRKAALVSAQANVEVQDASEKDSESQWEKAQMMANVKGAMSQEEADRRHHVYTGSLAKLLQAKADVKSAEASIHSTEIELERRIVRAPVDGTVMQCKIHLGEFAQAGPVNPPLMMIGGTDTLNVRVDIDENDAWRMEREKPAVAYVKGNRDLSTPLKFVRVEPYVIPKASLTGDSSERVDTRVLQVLFSFDPKSMKNIYVGQQMDVFIEAPPIGR